MSSQSMKEMALPGNSYGTPNDVRFFPTSSTRSLPTNSSTRSIPIASAAPSMTEIQQDEEEQLAEYRDQAMYLRIVHGMKGKQQSALHPSQITLSDCVANIARTRNSKLIRDESSGHYAVKDRQAVNDVRLGYQNVMQNYRDSYGSNPEEEGIFDMDL
jgi:hypothetical protein